MFIAAIQRRENRARANRVIDNNAAFACGKNATDWVKKLNNNN